MIGLLATKSNPFTFRYIQSLKQSALPWVGLIYDTKDISSRDINIIHDRTANVFSSPTSFALDAARDFAFTVNAPHLFSEIAPIIESQDIKVLINIGSPRKLSKQIIDKTPSGIINIHPGYLPYFRGCSAVEWSLLEDFPVTNTIHYMSEEYDEGPVIGTYKVNLEPDDNYCQIRQKVHSHSFHLFSLVVDKLLENNLAKFNSIPQDHSVAKLRPPVDDSQMELVRSLSAKRLIANPQNINFFSML